MANYLRSCWMSLGLLRAAQLHQEALRAVATQAANFRFEVATSKHARDIEKFLLEQFAKNEPITVSLKSSEQEYSQIFYDLAEAGYSNEKYSTVVYDKARLAALVLCAVKKMDADGEEIPPDIDVERHDFAEEIRNGPYKQHRSNQLLNYVVALEHRQKRLLGIHSKVFKLDVIGVHKDYRGQGLGQKLTQLAIDKARAEDCDWIATAATARASQGIFSKMGFKTLYEIPYSLFRENEKVVFQKLHDGGQEGKFMALKLK